MKQEIPIDQYAYELPESRIAQEAVEPRDHSKLLFYNKGKISDFVFRDLPELLPSDAVLFMNNARVIPARIHLKNSNGAAIEVFLLQPSGSDHSTALGAESTCKWQCLIGNKKKWKTDEILSIQAGHTLLQLRLTGYDTVEFSWNDGRVFASVLEDIGKIPLPPYIKHQAGESDAERYQTVYSEVAGSVAAPTAGLHFTAEVLEELKRRKLGLQQLTLHVGAGTFMPVKSEDAREHPMHKEVFTVERSMLEALKKAGFPVAVGTTSCRVLESLYWIAENIRAGYERPFEVGQFRYEEKRELNGRAEATEVLLAYMEMHGMKEIFAETSIMITPGYNFMMCSGLISNFHQPRSTLLLLIAALIGSDWKDVYRHALNENYRFLSYGDSSLLIPK